ncbi:hypothetical protein EJ110_NYTH19170 [Nymphaea thermarum]|nr:hypothetical protein EJ110_NYTH19170 [Nymphaea thermarum]
MFQWNAFSSLVSVKLDSSNYLLWRSQIESIMFSQDLIKFVDGSCPAPNQFIDEGANKRADRAKITATRLAKTMAIVNNRPSAEGAVAAAVAGSRRAMRSEEARPASVHYKLTEKKRRERKKICCDRWEVHSFFFYISVLYLAEQALLLLLVAQVHQRLQRSLEAAARIPFGKRQKQEGGEEEEEEKQSLINGFPSKGLLTAKN